VRALCSREEWWDTIIIIILSALDLTFLKYSFHKHILFPQSQLCSWLNKDQRFFKFW
jgi:hypothetical protein